MNLMGKIFTLLIFFMSICFLVISVMVGASHRNWKSEAEKLRAAETLTKNQLNEARSSTSEKENLLSAERAARALQLAQLESQLKAAQASVIAKEAQLRKVSEISQATLAELEKAQALIKDQDAEVADLRARNTKLVDDIGTQLAMVTNLTNKSYEQENQITLLTEKEGDMRSMLTKMQRVMNANGLTATSLTDHIVPKLDGRVLRVNEDNLFAVSLGTDDGIRVGHVLDVYRENKFVGKGTIIKTESDLSAARLNPDFKLDSVKEGDYVTSKF